MARQLLLDPLDERRRRLEIVTDQVRTRFAAARLYALPCAAWPDRGCRPGRRYEIHARRRQ